MSRHSATLPGTSAPGGEADVIAAKADIAPRMSAIRGKADVWRDRRFGLLVAEGVEELGLEAVFDVRFC